MEIVDLGRAGSRALRPGPRCFVIAAQGPKEKEFMRNTIFKHISLATALIMIVAAAVYTQDEREKGEVFGGYSYLNTDLLDSEDADFFGVERRGSGHGVNLSFTGNFHKWMGAKFDYSFHTGEINLVDSNLSTDVDHRTHQVLFGIQVKNNLKDGPRFKPWAHVLAGAAIQKLDFTDVFLNGAALERTRPLSPRREGIIMIPSEFTIDSTDFAMAFGGGLDVEIHKNIDIRVIQIDYNPIFRRDKDDDILGFIPGRTQNNVRLSFGVVFHY
jgi:opacity protein-like surface antigen